VVVAMQGHCHWLIENLMVQILLHFRGIIRSTHKGFLDDLLCGFWENGIFDKFWSNVSYSAKTVFCYLYVLQDDLSLPLFGVSKGIWHAQLTVALIRGDQRVMWLYLL